MTTRVNPSTLTSAADRSVRMAPPPRVRLGYLYTAGIASSVSWRVTHTHTGDAMRAVDVASSLRRWLCWVVGWGVGVGVLCW